LRKGSRRLKREKGRDEEEKAHKENKMKTLAIFLVSVFVLAKALIAYATSLGL
jgi:hypothetical protein